MDEENAFPPVAAGVPADYHPLSLQGDDLSIRAGQTALASAYTSWTFLEETSLEIQDKSKLTNVVANEMTKTLEKLDKSIQYAAGQEKSYHDATVKAVASYKSPHAAEIRDVLRSSKLPLSALIQEAQANPHVAASLHGLPGVLTGLKPDEQAKLDEAIEIAWASKDYASRASARKVHAKLVAAKERFGMTWMKRLAAYGNSDETKLAERLKKRGIAA
jgi:hypothetical protein